MYIPCGGGSERGRIARTRFRFSLPPVPAPPVLAPAEMRARGYFRTSIEQAQRRLELQAAGERLIPQIEAAFAGVQLGGGLGLMDCQRRDAHGSAFAVGGYYGSDEAGDWRRIPIASLRHFRRSLKFFDAEGMRFHLPAFLIAALRGTGEAELISCLIRDTQRDQRPFALLTEPQRAAVRAALSHLGELAPGRIIRALEKAGSGFWSESNDRSEAR